MSVAQLKTAFLSIWHHQAKDGKSDSETFGSKVRRAYREGKLNERIQKAEIDYAEGRALDRLY
jgi:hypothetical protein